MHVRRVWFARQAVADHYIRALIQGRHVVGHRAEIDRINGRATAFVEAQAERGWAAMRLLDAADADAAEFQFTVDRPGFGNRPIEVRPRKGVTEPLLQLFKVGFPRMDRDRAADRVRYRPQFVQAMAMVAVRMSDDD